ELGEGGFGAPAGEHRRERLVSGGAILAADGRGGLRIGEGGAVGMAGQGSGEIAARRRGGGRTQQERNQQDERGAVTDRPSTSHFKDSSRRFRSPEPSNRRRPGCGPAPDKNSRWSAGSAGRRARHTSAANDRCPPSSVRRCRGSVFPLRPALHCTA